MSGRGVQWLAQRVVALRSERGLSQADLANASGLELDEVGAVEAAEVSASLGTMRSLARGFGMQMSELLRDPNDDDEAQLIGVCVRIWRRAQSKTLEELAAAVGLEPKRLAAIERGEARPDGPTLEALAQALGRSVGDLLGET